MGAFGSAHCAHCVFFRKTDFRHTNITRLKYSIHESNDGKLIIQYYFQVACIVKVTLSVGWLVGGSVGGLVSLSKKFLLFSIAPGLIKGEDEDGARRKKAPSLLKSPKSHWGRG